MKEYKLINNIELWGTDAEYGMLITEEDVVWLSREWGTDIEELLEDLEEI